MEYKYKKLFGYVNLIEPPKGLEENIVARIKLERKQADRFWFFISGVSAAFSLAAIVPLISYLDNSFSQSGFYQYFSLLFSGDSAIYAYWKELGAALVESAPIVGLIIFLSIVALFIWSSANLLKRNEIFINRISLKLWI